MSDRFTACLLFTLPREGGFVNDSRDPGGATNLGITLRTLSAWRRHPVSVADVRTLGHAEAAQIYRAQFWSAVRGDDLPPGVDLALFDWCVNSGAVRAIKGLQSALGQKPDGHFGLQTQQALRQRSDHQALVRAICGRRLSFLEALSTWKFFGRGWRSRVDACQITGLKMAAGPAR